MDLETHASGRTTVSQLCHVARATRRCLPTSGDIELISQQSQIESECNADFGESPPRGAQHEVCPSQGRKKQGIPWEIVDEDHMCTLLAAYNVHFENYSVNRINVTQLIPSLVWKETYATYLKAHPYSRFKQELLKEKLRETLKELKTKTSNEENSERAALQPNVMMAALRCTDGHAKRNVLRKRASILDRTRQGLDVEESSDEEDCVPIGTPDISKKARQGTRQATGQGTGQGKNIPKEGSSAGFGKDTEGSSKKIPKEGGSADFGKEREGSSVEKENMCKQSLTKAQMLLKQTTSIEKICKTYQRSLVKRDALMDLRIVANEFKHNKARIQNLKTARECEVITEEEFKIRVAALLELD